jgi:hypothetical protein
MVAGRQATTTEAGTNMGRKPNSTNTPQRTW